MPGTCLAFVRCRSTKSRPDRAEPRLRISAEELSVPAESSASLLQQPAGRVAHCSGIGGRYLVMVIGDEREPHERHRLKGPLNPPPYASGNASLDERNL